MCVLANSGRPYLGLTWEAHPLSSQLRPVSERTAYTEVETAILGIASIGRALQIVHMDAVLHLFSRFKVPYTLGW